MKMRNKRTGEIGRLCSTNWKERSLIVMDENGVQLGKYNSLAELNVEWEDVTEEPKLRWYIGSSGVVHKEKTTLYSEPREVIGNSFETEKEAEKAVEKLKAWKRLKDGGFEFSGIGFDEHGRIYVKTSLHISELNVMENPGLESRLNLLFGGEE